MRLVPSFCDSRGPENDQRPLGADQRRSSYRLAVTRCHQVVLRHENQPFLAFAGAATPTGGIVLVGWLARHRHGGKGHRPYTLALLSIITVGALLDALPDISEFESGGPGTAT